MFDVTWKFVLASDKGQQNLCQASEELVYQNLCAPFHVTEVFSHCEAFFRDDITRLEWLDLQSWFLIESDLLLFPRRRWKFNDRKCIHLTKKSSDGCEWSSFLGDTLWVEQIANKIQVLTQRWLRCLLTLIWIHLNFTKINLKCLDIIYFCIPGAMKQS